MCISKDVIYFVKSIQIFYNHRTFDETKMYLTLRPLLCPLMTLTLRSLQWRHDGHNGVSNHQPHDCLLICLFRRRSKKTSKLRVTGLCERNSPVDGEFPAQRASNVENGSIWWRHHGNRTYADTVIPKFVCRMYTYEIDTWRVKLFPNLQIWMMNAMCMRGAFEGSRLFYTVVTTSNSLI